MLFISMCSQSDTWIQIIVLAVTYYLKQKIKKFTNSVNNSDDKDKITDIDGKPPQFDLPMSHVVVDTNSSPGCKVILEVNEPDSNAGSLKDILNCNDDIVIKDSSTEETE